MDDADLAKNLSTLLSMGFGDDQAMNALLSSRNLDEALEMLISFPENSDPSPSFRAPPPPRPLSVTVPKVSSVFPSFIPVEVSKPKVTPKKNEDAPKYPPPPSNSISINPGLLDLKID